MAKYLAYFVPFEKTNCKDADFCTIFSVNAHSASGDLSSFVKMQNAAKHSANSLILPLKCLS
jgi:hypothetical protein